MINFFRKIRKKLADDNKPLKYIRYAIGEIFLVVIGILIALSINNWNEDQKEHKNTASTRKAHIRAIYLDLKSDVVNLTVIKSELTNRKLASQYLMPLFDSENPSIEDSLLFFHNWKKCDEAVIVDRNKNSWDDLNSTGKIQLLSEDALVNKLGDYYAFYDSRIKNYAQFPTETNLNLRAQHVENCLDIEMLNLKDDNSFYPNSDWFSCMLRDDDIRKYLFTTMASCYYNVPWFSNLQNQAQSIIAYLEENHSAIINAQ